MSNSTADAMMSRHAATASGGAPPSANRAKIAAAPTATCADASIVYGPIPLREEEAALTPPRLWLPARAACRCQPARRLHVARQHAASLETPKKRVQQRPEAYALGAQSERAGERVQPLDHGMLAVA